MEADITSQAVGLGANTDFSLMSLFLRADIIVKSCLLYTSPSPRDKRQSRMPSSA